MYPLIMYFFLILLFFFNFVCLFLYQISYILVCFFMFYVFFSFMAAFKHWSEKLVVYSCKGRTKGLLKPLSPQSSLSTFLLMLSIVVWKLQMTKQLRECWMWVLGSPLKTLMFFFKLRKSMLCFHKRIINPHLLMVLILGLVIFIFTISSSVVVLNFKMWSFKNLFWFNCLPIWYWGFVKGFQKTSALMWPNVL